MPAVFLDFSEGGQEEKNVKTIIIKKKSQNYLPALTEKSLFVPKIFVFM